MLLKAQNQLSIRILSVVVTIDKQYTRLIDWGNSYLDYVKIQLVLIIATQSMKTVNKTSTRQNNMNTVTFRSKVEKKLKAI